MTNNNTPTEPGWYYRDETSTEDQMVYVAGVSDGKAFYIQVNRDGLLSDSAESPKWLGPVPMPGEFVLIPKQPEPDGHMRSFAFQVVRDAEGNYVAQDLPPMEPIYDPEKRYSFTWDRETGEMTPRDTDDPEATP